MNSICNRTGLTHLRKWIVSLSVLLLLSNTLRANLLAHARIELDNGEYLIEKIDFSPGKVFENETEAKKDAEEIKNNPNLVKPEVSYYRIFVRGDDFVLRALKKGDGTNFLSNNNFFVSVTTNSNRAWYFEEAANRVTIVNDYVENPKLNTPYTALLNAGRYWVNDLKSLGVGAIDWNSTVVGDDGHFSGKYIFGGGISGVIFKDSTGRTTNIFCKGITVTFDRNYEIYYDSSTGQISRVLLSWRDKDSADWRKSIELTVIQSSILADGFDMDKYWQKYTNAATMLNDYNLKQNELKSILVNGKSTMFDKSAKNHQDNQRHARGFIISALIRILMGC